MSLTRDSRENRSVADTYSPFERPKEGFQRVSEADLTCLRGRPVSLAITTPIVIEERKDRV